MNRKAQDFHKEQYDACPCNYCNANPGCTNTLCILYAAYKRGETVPMALIEKFNEVRAR